MRKTILTVLAVVLIGSPSFAGPGAFAIQPTARPAKPTGSANRIGGWFSAVMPFRQKAAPTRPGQPVSQPLPPVRYNTRAQQADHEQLNPALSLDNQPKSPAQVLVAFAKVAESQGNHDAARQHLQKAVGAAPNDATTLRAAGHFEDRRGKLDVAEALYRRAAAADPIATAALNDLAICLARQDRMSESAATFRQAIAKDPSKALYRNNLAKVLVEQGETNAALDQLAAVHSLAVSHYNLGSLLSRRGDLAAAQQHYQIASTADPSLDEARHALAALLALPKDRTSKMATLPTPTELPAAPATPEPKHANATAPANGPVTTPLVTGAPITPPAPATPGFKPVAPGYTPAVASPYYLPPQAVQQR